MVTVELTTYDMNIIIAQLEFTLLEFEQADRKDSVYYIDTKKALRNIKSQLMKQYLDTE